MVPFNTEGGFIERSGMPAENQQLVPPLDGGDQGLFELIADGVPLLKDSDVKQKLLQWCACDN